MKNIFSIAFALFIIITFSGCGAGSQNNTDEMTGYADLYIQAIEALLEEDAALNGGMKYIAIDMKSLKGISGSDEDEIAKYFTDKYVEVKNATIDDLKKDGEFDETNLIIKNGIAIKVDYIIEFSEDTISFDATKYKSGLGSIGMRFEFSKGKAGWDMVEAKMTRIS
jgi:hypothetical protein